LGCVEARPVVDPSVTVPAPSTAPTPSPSPSPTLSPTPRVTATPARAFDALGNLLDTLAQSTPPRVAPLPRGPGQSAIRYAHRLYNDAEWTALAQVGLAAAAPVQPATSASPASDWQTPVERLQAEVNELRSTLSDLQRRIEALEG